MEKTNKAKTVWVVGVVADSELLPEARQIADEILAHNQDILFERSAPEQVRGGHAEQQQHESSGPIADTLRAGTVPSSTAPTPQHNIRIEHENGFTDFCPRCQQLAAYVRENLMREH